MLLLVVKYFSFTHRSHVFPQRYNKIYSRILDVFLSLLVKAKKTKK